MEDPSEDLTLAERMLVALLYAPGKTKRQAEPVFGRVTLAKLLFLLWKNPTTAPALHDVSFEPYDYGPWSDWIDVALDELSSRDLIAQAPGKATRISLTRKGTEEGKAIFADLPADQRAVVEDLKANFGSLSTEVLLDRVYAAYPEFATESKWKRGGG